MTTQELIDRIPTAQFATYARAVRERVMAGDESPETVAVLRAINVREGQELDPLSVTVIRGRSSPPQDGDNMPADPAWKMLLILGVAGFFTLWALRENRPRRVRR